jgi:hypothetical protein
MYATLMIVIDMLFGVKRLKNNDENPIKANHVFSLPGVGAGGGFTWYLLTFQKHFFFIQQCPLRYW